VRVGSRKGRGATPVKSVQLRRRTFLRIAIVPFVWTNDFIIADMEMKWRQQHVRHMKA
jgi:hypothetical protein